MTTPLTPPRSPPSSSPSTRTQELPNLPITEDTTPYDLFGVGFGPTHLALAVAFKEEHPAGRQLFVDAKDAFSWHSALLLHESRMQISFLKDLATFRNPRSHLTFLSFLHEHGTDRLATFSNVGSWTPSRAEWAAYLAWAAKKLDHVVRYSTRIVSVQPVEGSPTRLLKIICHDLTTNTLRSYITRNLSVGVGATPTIPALFTPFIRDPLASSCATRGRVAHTSDYLPTLARLVPDNVARAAFTGRFAVVGGGQSSAEVFNDLTTRFPRARVDLVHRSAALVPADDSPFVNARAFDPAMTDEFHDLSPERRAARLQEFRRANYACVAPELLENLYKMLYRQRVASDTARLSAPSGPAAPEQYRILATTDVAAARAVDGGVELDLVAAPAGGAARTERYDAVFLGTGYGRPPRALAFLADVRGALPALDAFLAPLAEDGAAVPQAKGYEALVTREYFIAPADDVAFEPRVFVLGCNERTHGLSDSLLSVGAVRAGEVVRALAGVEERTKVSQ